MKKSELLDWLQEQNQQWEAFLEQIGRERIEQPGVAAHWSVRDIVAHLNGWQRNLVGEFFDHFRDDHEPDIRAWLARVENQ
jgi:hypothetical protein